MAVLVYRTQQSYHGPWLIDQTSMDALDSVIDEQWTQLQAHKKKLIESAIDRAKYHMRKLDWYNNLDDNLRKEEDRKIKQKAENDPLYAEDGRFITLTFASGNKVMDASFRSLSSALECNDQLVTAAEVKLVCGGVKGQLNLPLPDKFYGLSIVTFPEGSEPAKELFVKLKMWADEHRPDFIRTLNGLPQPVVFAMLLCSVFLVFMLGMATGGISERRSWRNDARELVKTGVKPEDQSRALELLLRKEVDDPVMSDNLTGAIWVKIIMITVFLVWVPLMIRAHTAFAIGKGRSSVYWQKWYGYLLRKSIPGFVICGVLASALGNFVSSLFISP